jgi:hypothetical protein
MKRYSQHLAPEVVTKIRRLLAEGDSTPMLAERFGVTPGAINCIKRGKHHALPKQ